MKNQYLKYTRVSIDPLYKVINYWYNDYEFIKNKMEEAQENNSYDSYWEDKSNLDKLQEWIKKIDNNKEFIEWWKKKKNYELRKQLKTLKEIINKQMKNKKLEYLKCKKEFDNVKMKYESYLENLRVEINLMKGMKKNMYVNDEEYFKDKKKYKKKIKEYPKEKKKLERKLSTKINSCRAIVYKPLSEYFGQVKNLYTKILKEYKNNLISEKKVFDENLELTYESYCVTIDNKDNDYINAISEKNKIAKDNKNNPKEHYVSNWNQLKEKDPKKLPNYLYFDKKNININPIAFDKPARFSTKYRDLVNKKRKNDKKKPYCKSKSRAFYLQTKVKNLWNQSDLPEKTDEGKTKVEELKKSFIKRFDDAKKITDLQPIKNNSGEGYIRIKVHKLI